MKMEHTIETAILQGKEALLSSSTTPRLDAELLLIHILNIPRISLITESARQLPDHIFQAYWNLIKRRIAYEPIAYIIGRKEFWGLDFEVTSDVLIPRPETERAVEVALEFLKNRQGNLSILDLATGSGAIAIALASALSADKHPFSILATDISAAALTIAERNVRYHNFSSQIQISQSNWFSEVHSAFDLIISNPPYVALGASNMSPETRHEPANALFAGEDGLDAYRIIIKNAFSFVKPGGALILEIGSDQRSAIEGLLQSSVQIESLSFFQDLAGLERVAKIILPAHFKQ